MNTPLQNAPRRMPARPNPVGSHAQFDVLKIVSRHKLLIALGAVIGLVAGALIYAKTTPIYRSSTMVLIVNKRPEAIAGTSGQSYFNDYMATHQALIVSPVIVERAVAEGNLRTLRSYSGITSDEAVAGALIVQLKVSRGGIELGNAADNILTLSIQGPIPDDCVVVLNAVVDAYKQFLKETYDTMSADTLALMGEARDVLLVDLKGQEEAYRKFRVESPLISTGNEGEVNPLHTRLTLIQSQQSDLLLRRTELQSQLSAIQKAKAAGRDEEYLSTMVSNLALGADGILNAAITDQRQARDELEGDLQRLQTLLLPLIQQENELLATYGSSYPPLAVIRKKIEETREYLETPHEPVEVDDVISVQQYVEHLQQEIDRIKISEEVLASIYKSEFDDAKELTTYELKDEEFQRNMARTQQLYDGIVEQLQEASLVKDYGGFKADVISPAGFGARVAPDPKKIFPVALAMGAFLGCGLAFLAELANNTYQTPDEIRSSMALPVMGLIRQNSASGKSKRKTPDQEDCQLDQALDAYYRPLSPETEAFRALRTSIYFHNRGNTNKVIQVTSPSPGDGKSTVAANLSICMAQSGKRVLLIDADVRRPTQHSIFGLEPDHGLSSLICNGGEPADAVYETPVDNLWLLPVDQILPDPTELLTSPRFGELMMLLRDQYDYVIVDTGPLIAVSDPTIVMGWVDGMLLTVRVAKTARKQAERAKELLIALEAPVLGVVINAVGGAEASSYGYGYYRYYTDGDRKGKGRNGSHLTNGSAKKNRGNASTVRPSKSKPARIIVQDEGSKKTMRR